MLKIVLQVANLSATLKSILSEIDIAGVFCAEQQPSVQEEMLARASRLAAARASTSVATRPAAIFARNLAGPVSVTEIDQETIMGPSSVERTETTIEMGVAYAPGVPSPMEGATTTFEPIVVDGLVVKTGGAALGCPVQYIKLSAWDPTPVDCKYSGLRFVSKKALAYAAKAGK